MQWCEADSAQSNEFKLFQAVGTLAVTKKILFNYYREKDASIII